MADIFKMKTWDNFGESGATDDNSVLNKDNMNDLESRINNAISNLINKNGDGLNLKYQSANILPEYFSSGTCKYIKIGNLVIVYISNLIIAKDITEIHIPVITGVPKSQDYLDFMIFNHDSTSSRLRVTPQGNIETHYGTFKQGSSGHEIYAYAIYLSSE